tara:strand:- start:162 stop:512 length:351 start_codon:yes stop_codon:yes gene_type:complete
MTIKKETFFENNISRYNFDAKGYAQLDTTDDAWYYGHWIDFKNLRIISYAEGDVSIETCENKEEFKKLLKKVVDFLKFKTESFEGIDLMDDENNIKIFESLGLDKNYYLYKSYCEV